MGADRDPANEDRIQTQGRKDNAAKPLNAAPDNSGAERYPATKKDDSVESPGEARSFKRGGDNPQPRQGAGDGGPAPSSNEDRLGSGADPAEGKR